MPVRLTDYERDMLNGKYGRAKQLALEGIVRYGEILGASELVEVTKGHRCCGCTAVPADFPAGNLSGQMRFNMGYRHLFKQFVGTLPHFLCGMIFVKIPWNGNIFKQG